MECNKDEAKRAMDIAERKITEKDYNGAKYFANKAQNLFPELDGLKELLTVIDVYISGEKKICGETDWYGILGVHPFANDEAVKKQYRRLALMLHPDKNKSNIAEDAFKLVKEAWNQLSNKEKRLFYDIKIGKEAQPRFPQQPTSEGIRNVKKHVVPNARATTSKTVASMDGSRVGSPGFIAKEKTPPSNVPKPPINLSFNQHHMSSTYQASNKNSHGPSSRTEPAPSINHNFQWDSSSRMTGSESRNAPNQAVNVVQEAQVKRRFGESQERVSSMSEESKTFWTKCDNCSTQYEHLRVYLNKNLHCTYCTHGFIAKEKAPPSNVPKPPNNLSSNQHHMNSKNQASNKKSHGPSSRREPAPFVNHNFQWDSSSRMAGSESRNASNQAVNVVQEAQVKRGFGESQEKVTSMPEESKTFWTKCDNCSTQYEHLRVYLNKNLHCTYCTHGFIAKEKAPPSNVLKPPTNLSSNQQHKSSKHQASNKKSHGPSSKREPAPSVNHNFQWDSSSRMAGSASRNAPIQAANVVQKGQAKRGFGESQERDAARGFANSDLRNFKRAKTNDFHMGGQLVGNQTCARNVANGNTIGSHHPRVQGMMFPFDIVKTNTYLQRAYEKSEAVKEKSRVPEEEVGTDQD